MSILFCGVETLVSYDPESTYINETWHVFAFFFLLSISIVSELLHHLSFMVGLNIVANKKLSSDIEQPRRLSNDNFKVSTILLLYVTDNSLS